MTEAHQFLRGALVLGCWVVGLFFIRFWRTTHDRLFMFFALAFWVFGLNWLGLALVEVEHESRHWLFVVRLVAFALIIVAIIDKNRRSKTTRDDGGPMR